MKRLLQIFSSIMASKEIDPCVKDCELYLPKDCHKLITPCRILFIGNSGVGKTSLMIKLVENMHTCFDKIFTRIILCIPKRTTILLKDTIDSFKKVFEDLIVREGLPDFENIDHNMENTLLIIEERTHF